MAIPSSDSEDFSASSTIITFDPPIPLIRAPLRAGLADHPSNGPFVLAFRDALAWRTAFEASEAKLREQCEVGARVGCSLSASKKCKPPWWRTLFGSTAADFIERERCEEREMSSCLEAAKEPCIEFARKKCLPPYLDARIALDGQNQGSNFVLSGPLEGGAKSAAESLENQPVNCTPEVTNYRGSVLFGSNIGCKHSQDEVNADERLN